MSTEVRLYSSRVIALQTRECEVSSAHRKARNSTNASRQKRKHDSNFFPRGASPASNKWNSRDQGGQTRQHSRKS